jgi:isopenicillin-N N-acyltransferase-like protein
MNKKRLCFIVSGTVTLAVAVLLLWFGVLTSSRTRELGQDMLAFYDVLESGRESRVVLTIKPRRGMPEEVEKHALRLRFQGPDRLEAEVSIDGEPYRLGRNGDELWMHIPSQEMALIGRSEVPRFAADPESALPVELPPLRVPLSRARMRLLPALVVERAGDAFAFKEWVRKRWNLPRGEFRLLLDDETALPEHFDYEDDGLAFEVLFSEQALGRNVDDWGLSGGVRAAAEQVALSHLLKFAEIGIGRLNHHLPSLDEAERGHEILGQYGKGRLEEIDGTRVLFLEGTPEQMGMQHGALMGEEVRQLMESILYGVGVGSSFSEMRWFFGEIEAAQARLEPHIPPRHLREMDALALATGMHPQEIRLGNFFPELFHCSGFALHGAATVGGRIYHGRVLDYLRGLGLEENAVVMVVKPDEGNAWVNVGYAGFVGSVTAMNEKGVAIGEMGGRGEGNWDGMPMSQLMRQVMERADSVDDAVTIMKETPRTCEYYYVISDGKTGRAVGIKATPEVFETVWSGESHPQLPRPVEDTVILSSGDRYEVLVDRVSAGWGGFDAESALELMARPVCMTSNIQSVLFAPDTLDFWVANADSESVASHTRYTRYNLADLLGREEPLAAGGRSGSTERTSLRR